MRTFIPSMAHVSSGKFPCGWVSWGLFSFFYSLVSKIPPPTPRFVTLHQLHAAEGFQSHSETLLL